MLDLGAGFGAVTGELARRSTGQVFAFDYNEVSLREINDIVRVTKIAGDGANLPAVSSSFDLVFTQFTLLWIESLQSVLSEIWRVIMPGGVLLAIEPDYGGMIEYPNEIVTRDIWLSALTRSGANPYIGRQLPSLLERQNFRIQVNLLERLDHPSRTRFEYLRELDLTDDEQRKLSMVEAVSMDLKGWSQVAHLPIFMIVAEKPAT